MNLEQVEEECLRYLRQTANPVVPIRELLSRVNRKETLASLTEQQLLDFLRGHDLFKVIEPLDMLNDMTAAAGGETAGDAGPRVALRSRMPAGRQLNALMREQLEQMIDALNVAIEHAAETRSGQTLDRLREALAKAKSLQEKVEEFE